MCQMCFKHGANGKWYLNAKNYLKETAEEAHAYDYLEEFWGNLERSNLRKVYGIFNMKWLSTKVNTPLLGGILKWYANRGFLKDGRTKHVNLTSAQGHFGQVVPLEESKIIVRELAETVVKAICPCRYFNKGVKEATCLGFSPLLEVLPKLPRFIPENGVEILDGDKAASYLEEMSNKGYIHTIWCGPVPAIAAICSCEVPACGALRLRTDFDIKACWKGEYVAVLDDDKCIGCRNCEFICQFGAISFSPKKSKIEINPTLCYGCGNCRTVCEENAIRLIDRNENPITKGMY
jgi:NAD-dependent dihydropyrimidine dehydrogenase PreA subunit